MAKVAVKMTGVEKAAVLMVSLGVDASSEVLRRLEPDEVRALSATIASLRDLDDAKRDAVLKEFAKARAVAAAPREEHRNFAAEIVDHAIEHERIEVSFEDIGNLDDLSVKDIIKRVDLRTLCMAVKAADDNVKEILFRNMTEREAAQVRSEVLEIGPVKLRQVEEAQQRVTEIMRLILAGGKKGTKS